MDIEEEIHSLASEFEACKKTLNAIGDESRQHLILELLMLNACTGSRVGTISEKTHLSRPAVSHHLQILKDAGILKVRKEGTKNYYYFDPELEAFEQLIRMLSHAKKIAGHLPDIEEEDL